MKKITTITPEQEARYSEWVEKWIAIGLSTEPADFDAAEAAALRAYQYCDLPAPKVVLRMSSPFGATFGGSIAIAAIGGSQVGSQVESQVWSQVWSQVGSQVWSQVWSQVGSQVGSQVWSQVRSQVESQVRSQVWSQVRSQVESQVWSQVWSQVGSQVWSQVRSQVRSQVESQVWSQVGSQVWSQVESQVGSQVGDAVYNYRYGNLWSSGWCSFVSFIRDVLGWCGSTVDRFAVEEALAKSCGWVWWHEEVLAISDRPELIRIDPEGRLHCEDGPAIRYRDGWSVFSWRGTAIPSEWIESGVDAKTAITWENVEQRRCACEILGWHNVLRELNASTIHRHENPLVGELLEVELPDVGRERFLRVMCGTGREFALPVPPEMQTAMQAQAWLNHEDESGFVLPAMRT